MISKQYTKAEDIKCYVEGCTEHLAPAEPTELERAAAWTSWDYVGTN